MQNTCVICDHKKKTGIYLLNNFICNSCEKKLVSTNPTDEYYRHCINKLTNVHKSLQILH